MTGYYSGAAAQCRRFTGPVLRRWLHILKNKDVRQVAAFLNRLPEDFVQTELKFSELQAADIYPTIWDREDDEDIKYVSGHFADLRKFISDAAAEDHGIILALL